MADDLLSKLIDRPSVQTIDDNQNIFGGIFVTLKPGYCFKSPDSGTHECNFKSVQAAYEGTNKFCVFDCQCEDCRAYFNSQIYDFTIGLTFQKKVPIKAKTYADAIDQLKTQLDHDPSLTTVNTNLDYVSIHLNNNIVDYH